MALVNKTRRQSKLRRVDGPSVHVNDGTVVGRSEVMDMDAGEVGDGASDDEEFRKQWNDHRFSEAEVAQRLLSVPVSVFSGSRPS
jgi:hypothetical protein